MQSFLENRPQVLAECLPFPLPAIPGAGSAHSAPRTPPLASVGQPSLEWVEENGRINTLYVTCTCGCKIEVLCDYNR